MNEDRVLLDPTSESGAARRQPAPRVAEWRHPIALLDINKARGDVFLDEIERRLDDMGIASLRFRKPTIARPAPLDLRRQIIERCRAAVVALAD